MHIALMHPEIPQNTGNIARTCAATGISLHLIHPLGYSLEDRYLKRAGLDYWPMVKLTEHKSAQAFFQMFPPETCYFLSTKASKRYTQIEYGENTVLVFGCETRGLPEPLLKQHYHRCIRIPMLPGARSLNLSNSVAVVAYEGLRQQGFDGFLDQGALTGRPD